MSLFDFDFYSQNFMKIKTKMDGLQPFILREYQKRFLKFWDDIDGPVRIIVCKCRQAGFSTIVAGKYSHQMFTTEDYKGIAMADKSGRTSEIQGIYSTFLNHLPPEIKPMIEKDNTEEIRLDNPRKDQRKSNAGLRSGVLFETAQDPNAGRSGSRRFAHMSENAFYRYYREIDEGVQNSIPLAEGTAIIKESTANGRSGIGKPFYDLWCAAERGETVYKPFFVAWNEIDDYQMPLPRDFVLSQIEKEILEEYPHVTKENLMWRRLKISEYLADESDIFLTPAERFKQDFPLSPQEAFRHSGQPVFDSKVIEKNIQRLTKHRPKDMSDELIKDSYLLKQYREGLRLFSPPRRGKQYFIGADVSEGLAQGDASSACIFDENYMQVGVYHGRVDPDVFGHILIDLGRLYNMALLAPESNAMGHTTVTTIRNEGYGKLYKKITEDTVRKTKSAKYGWHTNKKSKHEMLGEAIACVRDENITVRDIEVYKEMETVARGENGDVNLNGKDRTVAFCITMVMIRQYRRDPVQTRERIDMVNSPVYKIDAERERRNKAKGNDLFD